MEYFITKDSKHWRYHFEYSFFNVIDTEEKAYWLGFLYADGYVSKYGVELALSAQDRDHLVKFADAIKADNSLIKLKANTNSYRIQVHSKEMVEALQDHGCYKAKSLTLQFPTEEQVPITLIHHFMRGYFDGDGTIYHNSYGYGIVEIVGTKDFLDRYETILIQNCRRKTLTKRGKQSKIHDHIQSIRYGGNQRVLDIYRFLYKDSTVFLTRKKKKFNQALCRLESKL